MVIILFVWIMLPSYSTTDSCPKVVPNGNWQVDKRTTANNGKIRTACSLPTIDLVITFHGFPSIEARVDVAESNDAMQKGQIDIIARAAPHT